MKNQVLTKIFLVGLTILIIQSSPAAPSDLPGGKVLKGDIAQSQALLNIQLNRASIIVGILDSVRSEAGDREFSDNWEEELGDVLEFATAAQLQSAEQALGYDAVVRSITDSGNWPDLNSLSRGGGITRALGSATSDLVFTPVIPCRIGDTRLTGAGRIPGGGERGFNVHGNLSAQGGTSCISPSFDPGAVAINITSTAQVSDGFLTVYPTGTSRPLASTLNYKSGQNIANSTVSRAGIAVGKDIQIFASSTSHVIIDLVGFFSAPVRTAPELFVTSENAIAVANGSNANLNAPNCPGGYTPISGGFRWNDFSSGLSNAFGGISGAHWICSGRNTSGSAKLLMCRTHCLRIPGR